MITLQDAHSARKRIRNYIYKTPLLRSEEIDAQLGAEVHFKMENFQITHAFKIRGSSNKMLQLSAEEKKRGVITASSGNHALGFSCAAQKLGIDAVVVMPARAPKTKVDRCRQYGAMVILHGDFYDDCVRHAKELCEKEERVYIPSFDDEQVIAGNGTMALEIFEELHDIDVIVAPIGGGGLVSGLGLVGKALHKNILIIGVEAEGAPSMLNAIQAGRVVALDSISTIADGIAVKTPGTINYEYVKRFCDKIVLVSDKEIVAAMNLIWEQLKAVVEGGGAAAYAAAIKLAGEIKGKRVVCIVTGGNIDKDVYVNYLKVGID